MNILKGLLLSLLLFLLSSVLTAQLSVQSNQTVEDYVENQLLGVGVTASNITFNGAPGDQVNLQFGYFQSNGSYIGMGSGLVLSTGDVVGVTLLGDSVYFGISTTIAVSNPQSGDPDLMSIASGTINDHAVLEFDFIPAESLLFLDFIFGSEEYPEYVNSFNDAFGMFLSGPGISGPYSSPSGFPDGSVNIATIPGGTPVSIDNVNNGNGDCFFGGPMGPCMNCEYYQDNCDIENGALDGQTIGLSASAEVVPGELYHIKIAIGDALDASFDSAVLLESNSFRSAGGTVGLTDSYIVDEGMIYPNPTTGILNLAYPDGKVVTHIEVIDVMGRIAFRSEPSDVLDLSQLESGTYTVKVYDSLGNVTIQSLIRE
jgi:large repetitive protein